LDDVYEPTVWYFEDVCFLEHLETASQSGNTIEDEEEEENYSNDSTIFVSTVHLQYIIVLSRVKYT
jgi:hypothetical protein